MRHQIYRVLDKSGFYDAATEGEAVPYLSRTMSYSATYSPEDDKLRLSCATRLDEETYGRVKAAGFSWAPKQQVFYAVWSPSREDLLLELAGEIDDEDSTLVDRAEQRAERFEDYKLNRLRDAEQARKSVAQIADGIPLGQPILVGHHSEKHARRDAEKIDDGMRKAVRMWEAAEYWKSRAAGALRHAKYKERPDVRARRIKTLEADLRKRERSTKDAQLAIKLWTAPEKELTYERARAIANSPVGSVSKCFTLAEYPRELPASQYEGMMSIWSALDGIINPEQARDISVRVNERVVARNQRWIDHLTNRLAYERTMLGEQGDTAADRYESIHDQPEADSYRPRAEPFDPEALQTTFEETP